MIFLITLLLAVLLCLAALALLSLGRWIGGENKSLKKNCGNPNPKEDCKGSSSCDVCGKNDDSPCK